MANIHTNLQNIVGEAVNPIAHLEKTWSQSELTKRVVRYIFNAAKSPELISMPWNEAAKKLVEHAMHGYCAACQEKPWFFEIDLAPAFASAAWELLSASGKPRIRYAELHEFVVQEYEEILDRTLLMKAMWDATNATFSDGNVRSKVYNALFRAYQPALDECLMDKRPMEELQRVELFTKRWVDDSMRRAWSSVENSERTITEANVSRLFQNLVAPFGDNHPFSCIPAVLTESIGRPPRDWGYIRTVVTHLFAAWQQESLLPCSKKRKTRSAAVPNGEVTPVDEPEEALSEAHRTRTGSMKVEAAPLRVSRLDAPRSAEALPLPRKREAPPAQSEDEEMEADYAGNEECEGHPECTSAEDCIGDPDERLVRHILEGREGDVYCESCWESFREQTVDLEGIWQDGEHAGEPYRLMRR